ncbi:MAG TPA: ATP-binding protein, partial [Bacteroidia bacterium]|nr:ATP-binding protein [Bacteroidia bacterium]
ELRTPITSIRAYLETILEQSLPEDKQQHFITQAYQQTLTLSEMIKDMSLLAKMEEAPNTFALENVKLIPLLEQLKTDVGDSLKQKNIQWHWQLPDNITIRGNASLLNSIFRNLIENSIRYAGESIEINLSVFNEDPEFYYFSFYDTGMGIPNESQLNRLFERFYRVQEGRTRDTGGSGLGLSIVKNAIQFHRGSITAKNRTNGGLEFIFTLHK